MDQKYIVAIELREPHPVAYNTTRRVEEKFETKADAVATYKMLLQTLHVLEAFSE